MSVISKDLLFQYNHENSFKFPDMELQKGQHQLILGQSGKGKTTFLHLLAGILKPSSGSILIENTDIAKLGNRAIDRFRGKNIGLIFQRSYFVKALTVKDNLYLAQKLAGRKEDVSQIKTILDQLNILKKIDELPVNLSIGEQQRVSIARAIINEPELILADEPTSALDDINAEKVASLLEETAAFCQATLIVVTHDQRLKNRFENVLEL